MVKKTSGISYSPTGLIQEKEILGALIVCGLGVDILFIVFGTWKSLDMGSIGNCG